MGITDPRVLELINMAAFTPGQRTEREQEKEYLGIIAQEKEKRVEIED
jgi:hypothetical protein